MLRVTVMEAWPSIFGDHFRVDAFPQEQRNAGVPGVVEAQSSRTTERTSPAFSIGRVVAAPATLALHAASGEKWSWIDLGVS